MLVGVIAITISITVTITITITIDTMIYDTILARVPSPTGT